MAIVPDSKNWTWVLDEVCPDCGFDARSLDRTQMGRLVREQAAAWPPLLAASSVRTRPTDHQWSALEYGCHVRDVLRVFDERLRLMLETDAAQFENWDQDVTAVAERYDQQDPAIVSRELLAAAANMADRWDVVRDDQWDRTGDRSDGSSFTVDTLARYFLHDPVHHVADVERGYAIIADS